MPYLKETVESILEQDHKRLKLYIVDDGSEDNRLTEKFVKSIKDKRVHYIYQTNGGQAKARNKGINLSKSPLIAFCDADDLWRKNKISAQITALLRDNKLGMVYGGINVIDADNAFIRALKPQYRGQIFTELLSGNCIVGSASMVIVRRDVLEKVGLFREDFLVGEDWELWLRISRKYRIDYVDDILADLRSLDDGMQKNWKKMADGLMYMLPIMINELLLNPKEAKILTATCMWQVSHFYFFNGQRFMAWKYMTKCLIANPKYLTDNERVFSIITIYLSSRIANIASRAIRKLSFWVKT